ncbi:GNAT family protein [Actinoplanes sp. NBRC 103695]|uniref:GNAT family N-acetyltransferase n=1 Tax=Actinoplanes sp. NBRC 103695 TaxID=3032202 RepID=UPI0024A1FA68|nr:GNAT family protein [Actinoplanes sp. NBRC 103695]GLZ00293.1 succinyl-CoA transferase Rv0802c [Actinoplanes sp. NBRC 103695]
MLTDHWPIAGLRLTTPRLELRVPDAEDLAALADVAARGVHDPAVQPFSVPWTEAEPAVVARNTIQFQWGTWARWSPDDWNLQFVVVADGEVIGTQAISAKRFAVLREVASGSWLGLAHQGQGYGKEMRAAVLELAFTGLGAEFAVSEAFEHNAASYGVSKRLGYADDGIERLVVRGEPMVGRRLRLDRASWAAARGVPVKIFGLDPCSEMFGLAGGEG